MEMAVYGVRLAAVAHDIFMKPRSSLKWDRAQVLLYNFSLAPVDTIASVIVDGIANLEEVTSQNNQQI